MNDFQENNARLRYTLVEDDEIFFTCDVDMHVLIICMR